MFEKKIRTIVFVLAAIISFSSVSVFAQAVQEPSASDGLSEVKIDTKNEGLKFTFGISGWLYGASIKSTTVDETGDWVDYRIRPELAFSNGDTFFKMRLEIDGIYGAYANSSTTNAMPVNADTRNVEVAYAFFQSKIKAVSGLTFIGGVAPDVVRVPFFFSDNAPLVALQMQTGPAKINVAYVKLSEGSLSNAGDNDDSEMGWFNTEISVSKIKVNPFFAYLKSDKAANLNTANTYGTSDSGFYKAMNSNSTAYLGGVLASADFGIFSSDATFEYAKGRNKTTKVDYSGYAADLDFNVKLGQVKLTGFGTVVSGDNGKDSSKSTAFSNFYIDNNHAASFGRRMFLLERAYTSQLSGSVAGKCGTDQGTASHKGGYVMGGFVAEANVISDVRVKAQTAYAQLQKAESGAGKKLGYEFDLGVYYGVATGTTFYVEVASLIAGNAFDTATMEASDPHAIIVGSTFKM